MDSFWLQEIFSGKIKANFINGFEVAQDWISAALTAPEYAIKRRKHKLVFKACSILY